MLVENDGLYAVIDLKTKNRNYEASAILFN